MVPKVDVELVKVALDRHGWRFISSGALEDRSGLADEPTIALLTCHVRSSGIEQRTARLADRVDAVLRDAGVRGLKSVVVVDGSVASEPQVEHWVRAPTPAVHIVGAELEARRAWARLGASGDMSGTTIERRPTAAERIRHATRQLKAPSSPGRSRALAVGLILAVGIGTFVASQGEARGVASP